ncbi:MAG: YHS domain-containing protein [Acidobacteria bacterium]|nr:MAG: YHS domain-containing protein [Acidobacteriota bacterium]
MFALIGWLGRVLLILFIVRLVMSLLTGGRSLGRRRTSAPGTGGTGNTRGTGRTPSAIGTRLVRDPHCGTYVAETTAVRTLHGGEMLYFCSNKCRDAYMAAPQANAS